MEVLQTLGRAQSLEDIEHARTEQQLLLLEVSQALGRYRAQSLEEIEHVRSEGGKILLVKSCRLLAATAR